VLPHNLMQIILALTPLMSAYLIERDIYIYSYTSLMTETQIESVAKRIGCDRHWHLTQKVNVR